LSEARTVRSVSIRRIWKGALFPIRYRAAFRDGGKPQPLLHHIHADEECGRDVLFGQALLAQGLERAELVERMQGYALHILGKRVIFGEDPGRGIAHHARHRRVLGKPLLLDEKLKRSIASSASGDLEHAGLRAIGIEDRTHVETLTQATPAGDVCGKVLDRDAGLHVPDVGLG